MTRNGFLLYVMHIRAELSMSLHPCEKLEWQLPLNMFEICSKFPQDGYLILISGVHSRLTSLEKEKENIVATITVATNAGLPVKCSTTNHAQKTILNE